MDFTIIFSERSAQSTYNTFWYDTYFWSPGAKYALYHYNRMGVGKGYHLVSPVLTVHPVFNGFFLYVYILINHWHQTLFSYAFARKYGNHLIEIFSVSFCRDTEEVDAVSNMLSVTVRNMLFTCTVKKPPPYQLLQGEFFSVFGNFFHCTCKSDIYRYHVTHSIDFFGVTADFHRSGLLRSCNSF